MSKQVVMAYIGLIVANICWGTGAAVSKVTLTTLPAPLLSALQIGIATAVLLIIQRRGNYPAILASDRWPMVWLSVVMNVAGFLFGYVGIALSQASDISLLVIGEVIFTALLAHWMLREHINRLRWMSLIIGSIGAIILIVGAIGRNSQSAPNRILGDLLFLVDMACCAYYTVQGGVFLQRNHTVSMMTFVNAASLVFWVPVLVWYIASGQFPVLTSASIIGLLYMALVMGVACVFLSFYAVKIIGATATTVGLFIQPLVGAVVGVFVIGDAITTSLITGAIVVLLAISLSVVSSRQSEVPA